MNEEDLQGAALAFRIASQLVFQEPDDERFATYIQEDVFDGAPFGEEDEAVNCGLGLMRGWCQAHAGLDTEQFGGLMRDMRSDWFMLLVGPGVPKAPSWAGFYLSPRSQLVSQVTLDVRKMYRDWGFEPDGINKEPDDSLGVLLGFLAELIDGEASLAGSDAERAAQARQTQERLLQSYVLPWITTWRWSVAKYARNDFLRGMGELVFGLCRAYAARFGVEFVDDGKESRFCRKGE